MWQTFDHQEDVIDQLDSGKILYGNVGAGKSRAALAYYMKKEFDYNLWKHHNVWKHIFVITTAKKRDSLDWEREAAMFGIGPDEFCTVGGILTVDSWNNIGKYTDIEGAFFIFDEQRLVGSGAWVKAFQKIAKKNRWLMLSATPGDTWMDYAPVFAANGFYRSVTAFKREHVLYEPFIRYPKVKGYLNETKLELLRNEILVEMPFIKHTERFLNWIDVSYDEELFRRVVVDRWHVYEDRPLVDVAELFRIMRKVVNSDPSRLDTLRYLMKAHPKLVIFYNFDYELEILRQLKDEVTVAEWNGHKKEQIPQTDRWVYLVQYVSGAEGWNCIETDSIVLYSLTYSYKNFVQAQGRIDRLDTKFHSLYYYVFVSNSKIDRAVRTSLGMKKSFNEKEWSMEDDEFWWETTSNFDFHRKIRQI